VLQKLGGSKPGEESQKKKRSEEGVKEGVWDLLQETAIQS